MRTIHDHSCWRVNRSDRGDIIFLIRGKVRFEQVAEISFIAFERDEFRSAAKLDYDCIVGALNNWFANPVYARKWLKEVESGSVEPQGTWELIKAEFDIDSRYDCGEDWV